MKKIPVKENAKYSGRTMSWTEEMSPCRIEGTFFHVSSEKINAFRAKETCFWKGTEPNSRGHVYMITVTDGRRGLDTKYDQEHRFELKETDEIFYLGEYTFVQDGCRVDHAGRTVPVMKCVKKEQQ